MIIHHRESIFQPVHIFMTNADQNVHEGSPEINIGIGIDTGYNNYFKHLGKTAN